MEVSCSDVMAKGAGCMQYKAKKHIFVGIGILVVPSRGSCFCFAAWLSQSCWVGVLLVDEQSAGFVVLDSLLQVWAASVPCHFTCTRFEGFELQLMQTKSSIDVAQQFALR